jgi:hypothetical protein
MPRSMANGSSEAVASYRWGWWCRCCGWCCCKHGVDGVIRSASPNGSRVATAVDGAADGVDGASGSGTASGGGSVIAAGEDADEGSGALDADTVSVD